jgi:competence protein ComEA
MMLMGIRQRVRTTHRNRGPLFLLLACLLFAVTAAGSATTPGLVDINTASAQTLASLPGMGREYARRIVAGRPYTEKNQLSLRGVLPDEEYRRIAPLIVAHRIAKR